MYSARYSLHEQTWFQTVGRVRGILKGRVDGNPLRDLTVHLDLRSELRGALRVSRIRGEIERLFIVHSGTAGEAAAVEQLMGRLASATGAGDDTVTIPSSAEEHDRLLRESPGLTCWCRQNRYALCGLEIADRISVIDHFAEILAALPKDVSFAYQVNFMPLGFDFDEVRYLRKLIARVGEQKAIPEAYREAYIGRVRKALDCELMVDEFVAVDTVDDARFVDVLFDRLDAHAVNGPVHATGSCFEDTARIAEFMETGIHSGYLGDLDCIERSALAAEKRAVLNLGFFENDPGGAIMSQLEVRDVRNHKRKILFLAANPDDTARLRIDGEIKRIDDGLQAAKYRDRFELVSKWAITVESLTKAMLDEEPPIVHFSAHGEGEGILVEGENGRAQLIPVDALSRIFRLFKGKVECVVLNACYTEEQAIAISKNGVYVVGMRSAIGDDAAVAFSVGFYQSLGAGRDYRFSYELGVAHVMSRVPDQSDIPVLWLDGKPVS